MSVLAQPEWRGDCITGGLRHVRCTAEYNWGLSMGDGDGEVEVTVTRDSTGGDQKYYLVDNEYYLGDNLLTLPKLVVLICACLPVTNAFACRDWLLLDNDPGDSKPQ